MRMPPPIHRAIVTAVAALAWLIGSAAMAAIEVAVDPNERPAKVEEALVGAAVATCDRARVDLVSLDAEGARWRVSGIKFPVNDFVANRRPAHLPVELNIDSMLLKQAQFLCHHQRCAVVQRHKSQMDAICGGIEWFAGSFH